MCLGPHLQEARRSGGVGRALHSAGAAERRVGPESDRETSPFAHPRVRLPVRIRPDCRPGVAGRPAESSVRSSWPSTLLFPSPRQGRPPVRADTTRPRETLWPHREGPPERRTLLYMSHVETALAGQMPWSLRHRHHHEARLQGPPPGRALMLDLPHRLHRGAADPLSLDLDLDGRHPSILLEELDGHEPRPLSILTVGTRFVVHAATVVYATITAVRRVSTVPAVRLFRHR